MWKRRAKFYEGVWIEAAKQVGADIINVVDNIYDIVCGNARVRVHEYEHSIDDPVTKKIAGNKQLVYSLLRKANIPTPDFEFIGRENIVIGEKFIQGDNGKYFVVKPAVGTGGGDGITTWVRGKKKLWRAVAYAGSFGRNILIEEQILGGMYRILYFEGEPIGAVVRKPPTVISDGKSRIKDLVKRENMERFQRGTELSLKLLSIDNDMVNTLDIQGFNMNSIPSESTVVQLKSVINQNRGEDNESALGVLCDSIIKTGAEAAKTVGVRVAGVDIITADPRVPLGKSGGVVIEVNAMPGYHEHYFKKDGRFPVAVHILKKYFRM